MKNKKLFAILTLVCFMFTLMPVAAFAGDGDVIKVVVNGNEKNSATITEGSTPTLKYYNAGTLENEGKGLFIVKDGVLKTTNSTLSYQFDSVGTYEVYAADATAIANVMTQPTLTKDQKLTLLKELETATEKAVTIKVKEVSGIKYAIAITNNAAEGNNVVLTQPAVSSDVEYDVTIDANNGWNDKGHFTAKLTKYTVANNVWTVDEVVEDAELTFTTAGYVDVELEDDAVTEYNGTVDFEVVANRTGEYKVIVAYGNKAEATLNITVNAEAIANVELVNAPKAPIDLDQDVYNADIEFKFTDASGRAFDGAQVFDTDEVRVTVTEKPADSTVDENTFTLSKEQSQREEDADGVYTLNGGFDEEGKYTIKVTLKNGASATATVDVAEQGEIVGIKYDVYNTPRTVNYGGQTAVTAVLAYDANGVVSYPTFPAVTFSANGIAIDKFNKMVADFDQDPNTPATEGTYPGGVMVKNDDDYIGSTITVMAEYKGFTTTTVLTVVDQAATISFAEANAEVGVNAEFVGTVLDANGNRVSIAKQDKNSTALVLEKPANAVAVADVDVDGKGNVVLSFLASEEGTYKVQVAVTYGADKFISGVATIVVGEGEGTFEDVVVMSIGANKVVVNSEVKDLVAAPMIKDARTFVPFRALAEAFGADVEWVEATQSVVAELNGVKVVMVIGEEAYTVNGVAKTADVAPFINGASTMVPVRFVAEAFGINVTPIYAENGAVADVLFAK